MADGRPFADCCRAWTPHVRDGLVPGHGALQRLRAARDAGIQAIWDLSHYHRNQDAVRCARIAAEAAYAINGEERLWLCPVNEPSLYPMIAGLPRHNAVDMAIQMAKVAPRPSPRCRHPYQRPDHGSRRAAVRGDRCDRLRRGCGRHRRELLPAHGADVASSRSCLQHGNDTANRSWFRKRAGTTAIRPPPPIPRIEQGDLAPTRAGSGRHRRLSWCGHRGRLLVSDCRLPTLAPPFSKDRWSHGLIRSDLSVDAPLSAELRSLRTDCVRQDVGIDAALPYDGSPGRSSDTDLIEVHSTFRG